MDCPKDLANRASILAWNGFGFQGPSEGVDNMFVPCLCRNLSVDELQRLKKLSGSNTVECDKIIIEFLAVHWTEYDKIPKILTSLLTMGISFTTQTKLRIYFDAKIDKEYTPELEEIKAIKEYSDPIFLNYPDLFKDAFYNMWNWKTIEGKEFCKLIREKTFRSNPQNMDTKENYYLWKIFQNYDPKTLMTIDSDPPRKKMKLK